MQQSGALLKFEKWSKVVACFYLADGPYGPLTQSPHPEIYRWMPTYAKDHAAGFNPVPDPVLLRKQHVSPG